MRDSGTEQEIMAHWRNDLTQPLVSVCCVTYNHEQYIEDALEGFLIQRTDFPFEILIHDDASTDRTAGIIRDYQKRYPLLVKPVLQSENQYSQGKNPLHAIIALSQSKYIAVCEGDDYWTDPQKLQIQVDFLESHPDYVISGHDAFEIDERGHQLKASRLPKEQKCDFDREKLIRGEVRILNMSRLYRNVIKEVVPERAKVMNGDVFLLSLLGRHGKSKYHPEIKPAAYRKHAGGVWSAIADRNRVDAQINTQYWLYRYFKRVGEDDYARYHWSKFLAYVFRASPPWELLRALFVRVSRWGLK